ncbi:hypothetical protein LPJ73_002705 [Coemansia sp. RSA 2703]|nr:hypothetical protein LPJ73_002705 [Coemansia sp. RSA 2703]KAJ2370995.1 hypothetical protein GGI05_007906 [Coemansia sp. RSA 2603]
MSSSRFISEDDIEEARKEREAAWKKAYESADHDPASAAAQDQSYDPRTLYERLQEQRQRKEETLAESRRFANRIRRLDEDETEFLEVVEDQEQEKIDEQKRAEMAALAAFREEVAESKGPAIVTSKRKARADESAKSVAAKSSILVKIGPVIVKKRKGNEGEDKERGDDDVANEKKDENPLLGLLAAYNSDSNNSGSDSDSGGSNENA